MKISVEGKKLARSTWTRHWLLSLALSLGIVGTAHWMDFPKPHIDDLYYIQTAATYTKEGHLDNSAFTAEFREGLTPGRDFGQLPFFSFVISLWARIFGLSATSLQALFLCFLFCGVFAILDLSRRLGVRLFFSFLSAAIFAVSLSLFGFRMDVLSLFLFFLGWWALFPGKSWSYFAGLGILAGSSAVYPSGFFFGLPVFSCFYFRDIVRPRLLWSNRHLMILASGLFWVAFFILLMNHLIQGDWKSFLADYRISAAQANPGIPFSLNQFRLAWFIGTEGSFYFPKIGFVLLSLGLAVLLLMGTSRFRVLQSVAVPCWILGSGVLLNAGLVPLKFRLFSACSVVIAGWALSGFYRIAPNSFVRFFCICGISAYGALAAPGLSYGLLQSSPKPYFLTPIIHNLHQKGYTVLVDSNAAKFGLDWVLPEGTYNFFTSRSVINPDPLKRVLPRTWRDFHENEVAILNWNDSLGLLTGRSLWLNIGRFRLPVSPSKSDVFFVSRNGVLGSVYEFDSETLPSLR